jgi:hypothetical protein
MRGLGYGVQFEIARLVSQGHLEYNHILVADLDKLKGSNKEAVPKVAQVLLKVAADQREAEIHKTVFAKEMSAKASALHSRARG